MKLYRLSLMIGNEEQINDKNFKIAKFEILKENDINIFVSNPYSDKQRVSKKRLLRLESDLRENLYTLINYSIYCYDYDLEKAKQMLLDKFLEEINKRKSAINILEDNLKKIINKGE